jgi:hypothetical protein
VSERLCLLLLRKSGVKLLNVNVKRGEEGGQCEHRVDNLNLENGFRSSR